MPEQPKTLGEHIFDVREASRLRRNGWCIKWDDQIASVKAEYE